MIIISSPFSENTEQQRYLNIKRARVPIPTGTGSLLTADLVSIRVVDFCASVSAWEHHRRPRLSCVDVLSM